MLRCIDRPTVGSGLPAENNNCLLCSKEKLYIKPSGNPQNARRLAQFLL